MLFYTVPTAAISTPSFRRKPESRKFAAQAGIQKFAAKDGIQEV
jgi:hypothetical protein